MPFQNQLHVDTLLGNISVKYRNAEYIAMDVFPEVPVKKSSDLYRVYDRNFRIPETARNAKAAAREHTFEVSTASYNLERHALKDYVADSDADNYDLADLRADTTEELTDVILRRLEKAVADLFTLTNWSLNVSLAAGAQWTSNTTTSNPIPVWDTGASTIVGNAGIMPNFGILPRDAFVACKSHISVLDRTKYTSAEMTKEMLAGLFDLKELLVPVAQIDTSNLGATQTISNVYGDVSFLGFKPPKAGPKVLSAGYVFRKAMPLVKRYRVEERDADAIEVNMEYVPKVVASLAGYLIRDCV